MKSLATAILALCLCGCGFVRIQGDHMTVTCIYVLKDPHLDSLTYHIETPTTKETVNGNGYASTTRAEAIAATGNVIATVAKLIAGL